ncbi:MAG: hypothetical protein ABIX28_23225 [Vicinamibacterales bacterium]
MSRRGDGWDNAVRESFFSTVKTELGEHYESHRDARMALFDYIEAFLRQAESVMALISQSRSEPWDPHAASSDGRNRRRCAPARHPWRAYEPRYD